MITRAGLYRMVKSFGDPVWEWVQSRATMATIALLDGAGPNGEVIHLCDFANMLVMAGSSVEMTNANGYRIRHSHGQTLSVTLEDTNLARFGRHDFDFAR